MTKGQSKLSTANLQKVLDTLLSVSDWRKAMASIRASESLAFSWRAKCIEAQKANDTSSIFFVEWRGAYDWWINHCGRARTENIILYESVLRNQALHGIEIPVLDPATQRPLFVEDPDLIDVSDEDLWNLYGRRHRYLLDDKKRPVPLTRTEQIPAPLRLRVLEQDRRYVARQEIESHVQVTATAKPFQRLPGEERPPGTLEKLKRLASMTAEQRREALGASAVPLDSTGRVTQVNRGVPLAIGDNRPDDGPELKKPPNPRAYQEPKLNPPTRPSYARPSTALDRGEGTGRGEIPEGGMKVC
jgi:hypothetical protein